ncbi:phosphonate metabolism protein/1,5-bisphosphokinase (PRPP-forming) PhnN [Pelagibius sp. Alg239-R121]|uniref:phosphonate metabolism protein/1,5-bisphosphokinase (PRPP-forming) PhnN n=1 Tax=Pelagibius sp. Alg239-R121 TaxID=2993448 RepID=UPI0024A63D2B|nr:phosphonate metabolism protein/1,5-bisphosphokinase (PRPP-forming) PhnN [Pelagibius sp. Alg239-R121]
MTSKRAGRGTLVLVVGPSGSGKDSILGGVETALGKDRDFYFPRRDITRPGAFGGEPYRSLSVDEFQDQKAKGAYSLSWFAHGLSYGIPKVIERQLDNGHHVVVNVSRGVIPEARQRLQPVRIVSIEVPQETLRHRLKGRNRESESEIELRLERAAAFKIKGQDVFGLNNESTLDSAVEKFVALLTEISQAMENARAH